MHSAGLAASHWIIGAEHLAIMVGLVVLVRESRRGRCS